MPTEFFILACVFISLSTNWQMLLNVINNVSVTFGVAWRVRKSGCSFKFSPE